MIDGGTAVADRDYVAPGTGDGFYQRVDTYAMHTPATLAAHCTGQGLQAALDELRRFEVQGAGTAAASASVKRADDAAW